jgi:signal transduction histidine kinase
VAAIEKQVASARARHNIDIEFDAIDEPECRLDVKEALYRIAQEALHNVVKHADARHVQVRLEGAGEGSLILTVQDDGRGFDPAGSFPGHIGLHSMQERAERVGGSVTLESRPGAGTRVLVRVPLER